MVSFFFLTSKKATLFHERAFLGTNRRIEWIFQGSVLGPLLFVLFVDDISIVVNVNMYADDTKLYDNQKNSESLHRD